jgi:hypothetical protein
MIILSSLFLQVYLKGGACLCGFWGIVSLSYSYQLLMTLGILSLIFFACYLLSFYYPMALISFLMLIGSYGIYGYILMGFYTCLIKDYIFSACIFLIITFVILWFFEKIKVSRGVIFVVPGMSSFKESVFWLIFTIVSGFLYYVPALKVIVNTPIYLFFTRGSQGSATVFFMFFGVCLLAQFILLVRMSNNSEKFYVL